MEELWWCLGTSVGVPMPSSKDGVSHSLVRQTWKILGWDNFALNKIVALLYICQGPEPTKTEIGLNLLQIKYIYLWTKYLFYLMNYLQGARCRQRSHEEKKWRADDCIIAMAENLAEIFDLLEEEKRQGNDHLLKAVEKALESFWVQKRIEIL